MAQLTPLIAAIGPLLLWPIEIILPFPYIVEEIFKGGLVLLILNLSSRSLQEKILILSGFLFAFSESLLYLFNISLVGNSLTFLTRLVLTSLMHLCTLLVIYLFARKKSGLIFLGITAAIIIHFSYNYLMSLN